MQPTLRNRSRVKEVVEVTSLRPEDRISSRVVVQQVAYLLRAINFPTSSQTPLLQGAILGADVAFAALRNLSPPALASELDPAALTRSGLQVVSPIIVRYGQGQNSA